MTNITASEAFKETQETSKNEDNFIYEPKWTLEPFQQNFFA
jgi:hypothetical protein